MIQRDRYDAGMPYLISFLAVALVPLVLAAYGGHLAASVLAGENRRRALWFVWSLAAVGVFMAGLQQYNAYRSDKDHDDKQIVLQSKLDASLLSQARISGQLDSIGLMLGTIGERNRDVGLGQLAAAIKKMAENASKAFKRTFADLGTASDGTQVYCSNCRVASPLDNTCVGSGPGAIATRINGVWKCAL